MGHQFKNSPQCVDQPNPRDARPQRPCFLLLGVGDIPDAVYSIPWNHETRDSGLK